MNAASSVDQAHDRRGSLVIVLGLALGVVAVAIVRLALFGWGDVAPDDARYVFVGLSTLDGHGPVTPSGNLFLLRSPVYGIALAAGRWLSADGPVGGARIVAAALTVTGLIGAIWLGWSLAGSLGALGTALGLLSMTLIWRLLPTIRIDLPQTTGVIAVLLATRRPTARRWALAGAVFGITILVKETILLLAFLPVAFADMVPRARLARLWGLFLVTAALVASWWWIVVWTQSGAVFPLNAVGVIERRDVGADLRLDTFGLALVSVIAAAWLVVLMIARRDRDLRLLVTAAICLAPPAGYAIANGLSTRNLAGLAVLSAVAIGVAFARIAGLVAARIPAGRMTAAASIVVLVIGLFGAAAGQARVGDPGESALPGQIAAWLRANAPAGSHAVMTFRDSEIVALELYGQISIPGLAGVRVTSDVPLSDFVWIGLRDRQLFGYTRSGWEQTLTQPGTGDLVLAGPHALTPAELMPALDRGSVPGVVLARQFTTASEWASIYAVTPASIDARPDAVHLHLSPAAAIAWLDLAGGNGALDAAQRLADVAPVVVGTDTDALVRRLAGVACLDADPADGPESWRIAVIGSDCPHGG
jgi:hypothetical protein